MLSVISHMRRGWTGPLVLVSLWLVGVVGAATPGEPIGGHGGGDPKTPSTTEQTEAPDLRQEAIVAGRAGNAELMALDNLRRDTVRKNAEIEALEADKRIGELRTEVGINNAQGDLPELVGLYQMPKRTWAEFLVGNAVLSASPGDWVTTEWRLVDILPNGVTLINPAKQKRTLLFGRRSAGSNPNQGPVGPAGLRKRSP